MNVVSHTKPSHEPSGFGLAVQQFLFRQRPQYWLARLYLCCSLMVSVWIAFHSPWNQQREILDLIGEGGWLLLTSVAVLAAIGIVDVVINDLLPPRFSMKWADEHRHQVFMALALLLCSMVYINVTKGSSTVLILRYSLESFFCVGIAVFDTIARVQQVKMRSVRVRS